MEIKGKIVEIMEPETGEGRNGPWRKQNFVIETLEQYPRKVCLTVWGDKVNIGQFSAGTVVTADINIESREYNGRWYTDVKAWRVRADEQTSDPAGPPPFDAPVSLTDDDSDNPAEDLPF
ncbi:MAG: DUF3127 domain-containing protein [Bacteroidales bacterium]